MGILRWVIKQVQAIRAGTRAGSQAYGNPIRLKDRPIATDKTKVAKSKTDTGPRNGAV